MVIEALRSDGWRTVRAHGVRFDVPGDWERIETPGPSTAFAEPEGTQNEFRANVVVLSRPVDQSIAEFGVSALQQAVEFLAPSHVVSHEPWGVEEPQDRITEFLYWDGGVCVDVQRWSLIRAHRAVEVTFSSSLLDRLGFESISNWIATSTEAETT